MSDTQADKVADRSSDSLGQASGSHDRSDLRRLGVGVPDDAMVDRNVVARLRDPSRIA